MQTNNNDITEADVEDMTTYHSPDSEKTQKYKNINEATKKFVITILKNCKNSPDRSAAIRAARLARLWANSNIATDGKY